MPFFFLLVTFIGSSVLVCTTSPDISNDGEDGIRGGKVSLSWRTGVCWRDGSTDIVVRTAASGISPSRSITNGSAVNVLEVALREGSLGSCVSAQNMSELTGRGRGKQTWDK